MDKLRDNLLGIWGTMSPRRRWMTGGILGACLVGFALIIALGTRTNWAPLGRASAVDGLDRAVAALDEAKIPARMAANDTIEVPDSQVERARLIIATAEGRDRLVGMEFFHENHTWMGRDILDINKKTAVETELVRSILVNPNVEAARVHLVAPEKKGLRKYRRPGSAAVTLKLRDGLTLTREQVRGIQNLVARGAGIEPQTVAINDQFGNILAQPRNPGEALTADLQELRELREADIKRRVEAMVGPIVEGRKFRVQVAVELETATISELKTSVDPEGGTKMEQTFQDTSNRTEPTPRGVAGVSGNLPGARGQNPNAKSSKQKARSLIQYENGRTQVRTTRPAGDTKRIFVAVVVDGEETTDADGDTIWKPMPADRLEKIRALARTAAGVSKLRNDQVTVQSERFIEEELPAPPETPFELAPWMKDVMLAVMVLLLALLLVFGVVRPIVKAMGVNAMAPGEMSPALALAGGAELPAMEAETLQTAAGALPEASAAGAAAETAGDPASSDEKKHDADDEAVETVALGERLRMRAVENTVRDTERAIKIIRNWLRAEV